MTKTPEQLAQDVSLYLDQQTADLTILKVTLQVLIWNLLRRDSHAQDALGHLKNEVLASLFKTMTPPSSAPIVKETDRMRQLALIRAEKMFQDIAQTMSANDMPSKDMAAKDLAAKRKLKVSASN